MCKSHEATVISMSPTSLQGAASLWPCTVYQSCQCLGNHITRVAVPEHESMGSLAGPSSELLGKGEMLVFSRPPPSRGPTTLHLLDFHTSVCSPRRQSQEGHRQ